MILVLIEAVQDPAVRDRLIVLYEKYYDFMVYKARQVSGDGTLAEDIVHDVFVRLIRDEGKWKSFSEDQLIAYAVRSVRNRAVDYLRKNRRLTVMPELAVTAVPDDFVEQVLEQADRQELYQALGQALRSLSDRDRTILIQKYIFEESNDQIAGRLGIQTESVPVTVYRARKRLLELLGAAVPDRSAGAES